MPSIYSRRLHGTWSARLKDASSFVIAHLNFFRIHLLVCTTFTPLIFSGILYATNGEYHISYIDCLFCCVTSMTVCGLATINLSTLTPFQQFLLFAQMCLGSPVRVLRRMRFKFPTHPEAEMARKASAKARRPVGVKIVPWWRRYTASKDVDRASDSSSEDHRGSARVRVDMIRRMDAAPQLVNPSGWISAGRSDFFTSNSEAPQNPSSKTQQRNDEYEMQSPGRYLAFADIDNPSLVEHAMRVAEPGQQAPAGEAPDSAGLSDARSVQSAQSNGRDKSNVDLVSQQSPLPRSVTITLASQGRSETFSRTQTIEFANSPRPNREVRSNRSVAPSGWDDYGSSRDRRSMRRPTLSYPQSNASYHSRRTERTHTLHSGFGGFPMPHELFTSLFRRLFPQLEQKMTRTMTMPRTRTIVSQQSLAPSGRPVTYISFDAVVGRNSEFKELTNEQLEELGGVEYRALGPCSAGMGIIAPYMSMSRWQNDFHPPQLYRDVSPIWFSAFQVVSAYTNTGMSLEDESMVPFQKAYLMIFILIFLILAGNTALRFGIWVLSKVVPQGSRLNETLHFLLDHPRRCFVYLFPSHQTCLTDWFCFLVLDLGNPTITSIPVGVRVVIGTLQALAVRAAGFATVTLADLAPAVKSVDLSHLLVSMLMFVRSTNDEDEEESAEDDFNPTGNRVTVWSRYLAMHMRKQLSFDMWWLGLALVLVCIIEKDGLEDESSASWFNIFRLLFEVVSAYGTVGLSLGVPYDNFSFSGALRTLSKLIICAVMIRGRHRGLPVAIDRAVMLPAEFSHASTDRINEIASNNARRSSVTFDAMSADADERSQLRRSHVRSPSTMKSGGPESAQSQPNQEMLQQPATTAAAETTTAAA
ncbi:cation transport protein-domain-containing protein [Fomitopsis serialis]|uniref:cation transport protein-domain-containing protein n=1 Tax=Fomitopsis serialis TaxID=139415 RepID=UPI0020085712|nr:cation transport protein-domain-containing protein [Neoantrodia serialis]KAH9911185.1 cation transport protein-domain-containing protein [Neoantrodia serialis]